MSIFDIPGRLWTLVRKVEDLFALQDKMQQSLDAIDERLRALETKMIKFEAEQDQLVTTAKAAAHVAASAVASAVVSETVTRLTRLEMKHESLQGRLSSPGSNAPG